MSQLGWEHEGRKRLVLQHWWEKGGLLCPLLLQDAGKKLELPGSFYLAWAGGPPQHHPSRSWRLGHPGPFLAVLSLASKVPLTLPLLQG